MLNQYTSVVDVTELPSTPITDYAQFPKGSGIYFVLSADNFVLYVGRSCHIRNRWSQHKKKEAVFAIPGARLAWLSARVFDLPLLERAFIKRFDPPMNNGLGGRRGRHGQLQLPM